MNIVILGPPGSGKDTQAEILSKRLNIPHVGMGNILRAVPTDTPLGREICSIIDTGQNVPSTIAMPLLLREINRSPHGFVLNNFPRSRDQLTAWKGYLEESEMRIDYVFLLETPYHVGQGRMRGRAKSSGKEARGDELVQEERERVGYTDAIQEILAFYRETSVVIRIDGMNSIDEVARDIWSAIHANA